jgi:transcriptional regulator with XRE-family HTH domain
VIPPFSARLHKFTGARIRNHRLALRMKQEDLAQRVGLSRTSITNIESGRQRLLLDHLYELAGALGVEPTELIPNRIEISEQTMPKFGKQNKLTSAQKEWAKKILIGK